jgi:Lrp/AsnC family transcriptional regulator, leucine-responsive regulatory protein
MKCQSYDKTSAETPSMGKEIAVTDVRDVKALDDTDWAILRELQADARLSMAELARRIHMSGPAAAERVRRLEKCGVITGYGATVDLAAVGRPMTAFLRIGAFSDIKDQVMTMIAEIPEVMECHRGTGHECFILKVAVADVRHLEQITDRFTHLGQLTTSVVLSTPLPGRAVEPLSPAAAAKTVGSANHRHTR